MKRRKGAKVIPIAVKNRCLVCGKGNKHMGAPCFVLIRCPHCGAKF